MIISDLGKIVSLYLQNSLSNGKYVKYISVSICPGFAPVKHFYSSLACQIRTTSFLHTLKVRRAQVTPGHSEDVCLEHSVIFHSWSSIGSLWQVLSALKKIPKRKDLAESTESSQRPSKHKLQGELEGMLSYSLQKRQRRTTYIACS